MTPKSERFPIAVQPRWSALLAVCKKCEEGNSTLADRVKARVKERGIEGIRALRSSCLDICPKKGVCATFVGSHGQKTAIFDTDADADSVIDYLKHPDAEVGATKKP